MEPVLDEAPGTTEAPAHTPTAEKSSWSSHTLAAVSPFDAIRQAQEAAAAVPANTPANAPTNATGDAVTDALLATEPAAEATPAESEATAETPADEEAAPVSPDAASGFDAVAEAIRTAVPGVALTDTTPEGFAAAFREQYETVQQYGDALTALDRATQVVPGLDAMLGAIARGEDPVAALSAHIPGLADALDPEEGTKAWEALQRERLKADIRAEFEGKASAEQTARVQRWERDSQAAFAAFEANPPEGVDVARFVELYASLFIPDATGRFRPDHFQQVAKIATYDADVKSAEAKGRQAGRDAVLAEIRSGKLTPAAQKDGAAAAAAGVPDLASGSSPARDLSALPPDQQRAARFSQAIAPAPQGSPWSRHARA